VSLKTSVLRGQRAKEGAPGGSVTPGGVGKTTIRLGGVMKALKKSFQLEA